MLTITTVTVHAARHLSRTKARDAEVSEPHDTRAVGGRSRVFVRYHLEECLLGTERTAVRIIMSGEYDRTSRRAKRKRNGEEERRQNGAQHAFSLWRSPHSQS
jgi:hypothetical protein